MNINKLVFKFCYQCRTWYIECPICGNNTCNGGSGEIMGKKCTMCDEIYDLLHTFGSRTHEALDNLFDPLEKE